MNRHTLALAVALACTAAGPARLCAQPGQAPLPSDLLTQEQLAAAGGENLDDALRRLRPQWLRLSAIHGRFADVWVDSSRLGSIDVLSSLSLAQVRWVQYSDADVVEERFGTDGRTPVIHVSTRLPLGAAHPEAPSAPFERRPLVSLFASATRAAGSDRFEGMNLNPGVGVGAELPLRRNIGVVAALSYVSGDRDSGPTEGEVGLWTGELGVKARLNSDRVISSFITAGGTAYRLRWGTVRANGAVRDEAFSETGIGLSAGAGVEVRLRRVLLFARGDVAAPSIGGATGEQLLTFRMGSSVALGASR